MPIISPIDPDAQLSQGDILRGVKLFYTADDSTLVGGKSGQSKESLSLVLSRPCNCLHKTTVIVSAIGKYKNAVPKDLEGFDGVKNFLETYRDGDASPDIFYLGQLPGLETDGRYSARLDSIHTIALPPKPEDRKAFLARHRVGRLTAEFSRDLHVRMFRAFASMGFDDTGWLSDPDLDWLIEKGEIELAQLAIQEREDKAARIAGGSATADASFKNRADTVEKKLAPYKAERDRRRQGTREESVLGAPPAEVAPVATSPASE